jgi:hypothetical protein
LKSLTVNAGGIFTSTDDVGIGAAVTSTDGFTLTVNKGGKATINQITKLAASTIAGELETPQSFTPNTTGTVSPLAIEAGGSINGITLPAPTTVSAITDLNAVTIEDITIPATEIFIIPGSTPGPAKTLTIAAGKTFTYDGAVTIAVGGKLVLATGTGSSVSKIVGTGKIDAGVTTITGAWEAVGAAAGSLTITSAATGATIGATTGATGLKASAAGATITQGIGTSAITSNLSIGVTTKIDLAGSTTAQAGEIILKGDVAYPGKITVGAANTSLVSAGVGGAGTPIGGVATITIGGVGVTGATFVAADYGVDASGFLLQIGGTTASGSVTAKTADVKINSTVRVTGS